MSDAAKLTMQGGAVRLTLPARVANDLEKLQNALGQLAERMGHPACATGCDTLFLQLEREFGVTVDGDLNPQPLPPGPPPEIALRQGHAVEVSLPDRVSGDIKSLQRAVAVTLNKLGCPACCSGFDIVFRRELDLISIGEDLKAQGFGRFR